MKIKEIDEMDWKKQIEKLEDELQKLTERENKIAERKKEVEEKQQGQQRDGSPQFFHPCIVRKSAVARTATPLARHAHAGIKP